MLRARGSDARGDEGEEQIKQLRFYRKLVSDRPRFADLVGRIDGAGHSRILRIGLVHKSGDGIFAVRHGTYVVRGRGVGYARFQDIEVEDDVFVLAFPRARLFD